MDAIDYLLSRGVDRIYPDKATLESVLRSGKKLRVYQGFDPTGTLLHIGHAVGFRKLRQFQDLGHEVIFLIGDGTGQAGDPSGKTKSRDTFYTREELRKNGKDYVMQAKKIVRFDGSNPVKILYNGDWLNDLTLLDILKIAGHFTLQQMVERDLYQERLKAGSDVNLREFLYPLLQGYDSVAMKVDLELGGSDQTFNMLSGRKLVKAYLGKQKFVMTVPLLTDSKGTKIGKTEGNIIGLTDPPNEFYGKILSLGDNSIIPCFTLLTDLSTEEIDALNKKMNDGENPMTFKKKLAFELTKQLHSEKDAVNSQKEFEVLHQSGDNSPFTYSLTSLPTIELNMISNNGRASGGTIEAGTVPLYVPSKSKFKRLQNQKAIEIIDTTNNKVTRVGETDTLQIKPGDILKIGKKIHIKVKK